MKYIKHTFIERLNALADLIEQPNPVFALFSGGKDSFATAKYLQENNLLRIAYM